MKKLLQSKWTACQPKNKEKHFIVTHVEKNSMDNQKIDYIIMTAVYTKKEYKMNYKELSNNSCWIQGWKD